MDDAFLAQQGRLNARTERRNWTELNWHGLVFDELINKQAQEQDALQ